MRPLRVEATLAGPIAGDVPMLDAVVEWRVSHRIDPAALEQRQRNGRHPGTIPIPIQRIRVAGYEWPIPSCSDPIYVAAHDRHDHFTRKLDVDTDLVSPRSRLVVMTQQGEFKSYRLPLRCREIRRIVWFCVGEGAELRRLLRDVKYLGKKTAHGYGMVERWTVTHADRDCSITAESDAGEVLMRKLPLSWATTRPRLIGARRFYGGIVSPYWDARYFTDGVMPC